MPAYEWTEDADGDWRLSIDGDYFGMVCPHRERFIMPAAIWRDDQHACADTVDGAKGLLLNAAYYYDGTEWTYPEC